jgi:hypothetical protein
LHGETVKKGVDADNACRSDSSLGGICTASDRNDSIYLGEFNTIPRDGADTPLSLLITVCARAATYA